MLFATASYELRLCASGAGGGSIASASWPTYTRPTSVGVIPEMWGYFGTDNSGGLKINTYDGTSAHYMQWRDNWDNTGTFASAPIKSAWKDSTLPAASPGTQPAAGVSGDGSCFVNGANPDTGTSPILSYIHANSYGFGVDASGTQQTPSANAGGTLAASSHSAVGAATTSLSEPAAPGAGLPLSRVGLAVAADVTVSTSLLSHTIRRPVGEQSFRMLPLFRHARQP